LETAEGCQSLYCIDKKNGRTTKGAVSVEYSLLFEKHPINDHSNGSEQKTNRKKIW